MNENLSKYVVTRTTKIFNIKSMSDFVNNFFSPNRSIELIVLLLIT